MRNNNNKWEKRYYPSKTIDEKMAKLDAIPTKRRAVEKFIDPYNYHWENRYYKKLFQLVIQIYFHTTGIYLWSHIFGQTHLFKHAHILYSS